MINLYTLERQKLVQPARVRNKATQDIEMFLRQKFPGHAEF